MVVHYLLPKAAQRLHVSKLCLRGPVPEIMRAAQGDDWNYAGWYVKMLGYAERGMFPIAYADW